MADYINKIRTTDGDKPINYESLANKPTSLPASDVYNWAKKSTPDTTLTKTGEAADAAVTGENINELKSDIDQLKQAGAGSGSGVTVAQSNSLWAIIQKAAFAEALTDEELNDFKTAWGITTENIPATGITLDKSTLSFTDSASQTLVATVEPSDTTDKVVWTSNAESVATVANGVVKPVSNGSATITATCGSVLATCSVTVDIAEEEQVTLTSISATYTGGEVAVGTALTALTGITVTGTYSDGSTATITGYTLSGTIAEGSNTITVSYGGKTTTFTVTGVAESGGDTTDISALILNEPYLVDEKTVANDWDGNNYDFVTASNKNNTPTVCASAIANQTPITDYFNSSYDVLYGIVYYPNRSDGYSTVTANVWSIRAYKDNYGSPDTQEVANCAFTINRTSDYKCYSYKLVKEDVISAIGATDYTQDDIIKISLPNQSNSKNTGLKSFWMATEPTMEQLEAIRDFFANGGEL